MKMWWLHLRMTVTWYRVLRREYKKNIQQQLDRRELHASTKGNAGR